MKIGSKSLLFGVHQFAWHPITVWIAWLKLYGVRPTWRETVCIIIHDWGYWGCASMDGPDGEQHPHFGALIAGWLFGSDYHSLVLRHSRFLALKDNAEPSRLCWADKVSMLYDPTWFYLFRARLSGEIREYRLLGVQRNNIPLAFTDRYWFESVRDSMRILSYRKAQVRQYNPPPNFAKETDSRHASYVSRYGVNSWELDALEPRALVTLIQNTTARYVDLSQWTASEERADLARKQLEKISENYDKVVAHLNRKPKRKK